MYAVVCEMNGRLWRGTFFTHKDDAMDYADRHPGAVAVEHIGYGFIWKREVENAKQGE